MRALGRDIRGTRAAIAAACGDEAAGRIAHGLCGYTAQPPLAALRNPAMEHVDTLISARWVLPVEPDGAVLSDHAIAVTNGRVVAVEPENQARQRFSAAQYVARPQHVLLPGLINTHAQSAMTLLRGAAESASFDEWLNRQVRPRERRWMDAEYVRDGADLAIADMLTSGTTCFADMHLFPESVAQAAAAARMRACIGAPVSDAPSAWATNADDCFTRGLELHDEYANDPLVTTALAPCPPGELSDATLERVRRNADEIDMPVFMEVNRTHEAAGQTSRQGNERTLARLQRLGLLSPLLCAVHMVHADADDLDLAAAGGISIAHCPQANLKLGNALCPVPAIRARGINLTLATAGAAGNNDLNLLDELRTAALLANHLGAGMTAHDWLRVATLNAARALGLADVGAIVPGNWADLCCIDLGRAHTQPVYDPAAQILFAASRDQVSDVWVAGRALVSAGRLTRLDLDAIVERARRWQQRIAAR